MSKIKCRYLFNLDYTLMNINRSVPNMATQRLATGTGWLSFTSSTPRLYVTAESEEFDEETLQAWRDEGFQVQYFAMGDGGKPYTEKLHSLGNGLSIGEKYAIIAFGDAASICLEAHLTPHTWNSRLCALVAYYPSSIPAPSTRYPSSIRVLVHLAGGTVGVNRNSEFLGLQGKRRTVTKKVTPGTGVGGLQMKIEYRCYTYVGVDVGFAERDLDEWDGVAEGLAWSRSLQTVRAAYNAHVELETEWEKGVEAKFHGSGDLDDDAEKIVSTFGTAREPYVVYGPTMTGGVGKAELDKFYGDVFLPVDEEEKKAINLSMRLISRTIGVDRIVDELLFQFTHAAEMDWILPGIPATGKDVQIVVVCIVAMRAGKIWCEHLYWDQAAVLVQTGLLDPTVVPDGLKQKGVERLPVLGKEAATGIVSMVSRSDGDGGVEELNRMIKDW